MREAWISAALVAALALTAAPLAAQQRARPTSALVVACGGTLAKDSNHLKLATAFDSKNVTFQGFFAHAGTPKTIVDKLNAALVSDLKRQETVDRFNAIGIVAQWDTPQQFRAFVAAESERWGKVIRAAGIELQ